MQFFFFSFADAIFFSMFLILLISLNKQVLLRNLFFLDLYMYSFEWEECGFGLSKIGNRLQGNRRWQPVALVEEELYHLSISTVIFSKVIVLLYSHRKVCDIFTKRIHIYWGIKLHVTNLIIIACLQLSDLLFFTSVLDFSDF